MIPVAPESTVNVRGDAELDVEPDFADINISVSARADDRVEATRQANDAAAAVRDALAAADGVRRQALSRARVVRERNWDDQRRVQVDGDWVATVSGGVEVVPASVSAVVAAAVAAGASIGWVSWRLDPVNAAYRSVRKQAVLDAHRAAEDFADALGAALGELVSLADPGLLDRGVEPAGARMNLAMASDAGGGGDGAELELDPQPCTVHAAVEARYRLRGVVEA